MSLNKLLSKLQLLDIELFIKNNQLRVASPPGVMTAELRTQLRHYKQEIIVFLNRVNHEDIQALITPVPRHGKLPLSFAQQRLWFLDQLGHGIAYNMPLALNLSGPLNVAALEKTLQEIVRRHESLRTTFAMDEGTPIQVIHPAMTIDLPVVELSAYAAEQQAAEVQRLTAAEATRPFSLSRDPMLRATLLQLGSIPVSPLKVPGDSHKDEDEDEDETNTPRASRRSRKDAIRYPAPIKPEAQGTPSDHHILLLTLHHIASDGWSMGVLVRELATLYEAFNRGQPSPLADLPIQYADFAVWQRDELQGEVLSRQLGYWMERLAGAPPLFQLPTDRPRPAQQSFRGDGVQVAIDASLTQLLRRLSQKQGTTLYMTLLAAFQVLMSRESLSTDVVVGSPIANRNRQEIEPLIGFFVNTLVLRADLSGHGLPPSFLEVLAQAQESTQAAYDHQDLPFERLVEELQPARNLNYSPLVQVVFALQNAPRGDFELPGLTVTLAGFEVQTTRVDLELHLWEVEDRLQGACIYSTDLFDEATIQRMMGHFQTLLAGIVADPQRSIAQLPLLTEAERHQILVEWNDTATDYPKDKCIHQLFEEQVERTPDAVAVLFDDADQPDITMQPAVVPEPVEATLTYRELNERANQLAHHLQSLGVGPETLVGICVERSPTMVVGLLGILKAGGAYLPLDPSYPQERLAFMLEDADVSVLLTQQHLRACATTAQDFGEAARTVVCLDSDWSLIANHIQDNPIEQVQPDKLAYVIYTSGSTGQPKGVLIPHSGLLNLVFWHQRFFSVTANDRATQVASLSFDAAVWEIWPYLAAGASLQLARPEILADPRQLRNWLIEHKISICFVPTPIAEQLLKLAWPDDNLLRIMLTGGDKLHQVNKKLPFQLFNNYGPTENTVVTTSVKLDSSADRTPPIGYPIDNVQVYILDPYLQPVPIGVSGELYIGGNSLARGYLNRPRLTKQRFIPNPFTHGRLYRTGDLARWLPNGNIEFQGRLDHQVKLRGFRIELGEIETTLTHHPAIQEAVVLAQEDQPGNKQLVGYLVASPAQESEHVGRGTPGGRPSLVPKVRSWLQGKLPDYMIPSAFVLLDALPLTPNGKVDRKALPAPDMSTMSRKETFVPPRTPQEMALANIWSEVLGVERIGIHDNFFELGGHSLLATKVVSRIRQILAVDVPLRTLFETMTVATLGTKIKQMTVGHETPSIPLADRAQPLPLSHAQERLWFLDQLGGGRNAYNMPAALRLVGELDVDALERSLQEIVRRHESLRTTFEIVDGQPVQRIHQGAFTLPIIDLSALSATEQEAEINRLVMAEVNHHFDLTRPPLFRATLVLEHQSNQVEMTANANEVAELRTEKQESHATRTRRSASSVEPPHAAPFDRLRTAPNHIFLINMHHSISDGWSMEIFNRELAALYTAFSQGQPSPLVPLPIQYADFALWQRSGQFDLAMSAQLDYWQQRLSHAPPLLMLPTDRPRPPVQTYKGTHYQFTLPKALSRRLQELSVASGVTLFMTMLAAFKVLLMRYSGQTDIVVGSPIANRNTLPIEPLIGCFVNTLVLRSDLSGNLTFRELLNQIKSTALDAYRHQDVPFEKVVDHLQPARSLSHSPLFQVMFDVLKSSFFTIDLPGLTLQSVHAEYPIAKFDLTLSILEDAIPEEAHSLLALIEYNTDLFDKATIERMAAHFQTLLQGIVDNPVSSITMLPLLTETERHQVLVEWNDTACPELVDYPKNKCIHHLFEEHAARTPEAVAVVFSGDVDADQQKMIMPPATLTYRELNERANQLAHHLQSLGVGPETLVAICVERELSMIIGILGILKAGGAYLPLEPAYPQQRLTFMLLDSQAAILLTQEKLVDQFVNSPVHTLCLDSAWPLIAQNESQNPTLQVKSNQLAYVIYTSGSTGQPKGVMVEHYSLVDHIKTVMDTYRVTTADRVLQFASTSFDVSLEQIFLALASGAGLVVRGNDLWTAKAFDQQVLTHRITVADLPPVYFHQLILHWLAESPPFLDGQLRLILIGGEKISPQTVKLWQQLSIPNVQLLNAYGPTETTITATCFDLSDYQVHHSAGMLKNLPIGQPLPNRTVYVLEPTRQPTPIGVPGELHIGGAGLARGYLNRPELTFDAFIPNPFGPQENPGRLYKTGDLARWLPDGNIEFLGRIDHQVKIRGFRIELGEIEAVLAQHPDVQEVIVIARPETSGQQRLVAYVTSEPHCPERSYGPPATRHPLPATLRDYLKQKLPGYMIPSAFLFLDALPLTPNGKVDRKALAALPADRTGNLLDKADFVTPRTPIEAELADIWHQLLQLPRVSIHDNFFTVGGDSILSLQLVSRARQRGIQISPPQIFQHQTIAELAAAVQPARSTNGGGGQTTSVPLPRPSGQAWTLDAQALVTGDAPLTPIQHGWAALNLPNPHIYNQSIFQEIDSQVDSALLRQALQILLRHHDALRLRYERRAAGWQQAYSPPNDEVCLHEIDVTALSEAAYRVKVTEVMHEIEGAIHLKTAPLMGLALLRRGDNKPSRLLWIVHHLVVDWVSWRILLADLSTVYQQLAHGDPVQLPAKTTSFQRWARWLHDRGPTVFAHELDYWVSRFERVQPLPQDKPDGVPTWASVRTVKAKLTIEETQALLQQAPAAYETQINDLLLTALLQTFTAWTQESSLLIELESHGRTPIANPQTGADSEIDLSRTVGWLTSAFPVRLAYQPGDLGDLILSVKEQLRQLPNQGLGYGILRYIQQRPELMPFPMPPICFNYLGQFVQPAANQGYNHPNGAPALLRGTGMDGFAEPTTVLNARLSDFFKQNGQAQFWNLFDLELMVVMGQFRVIWLYSENVHDRDTVERLTEGFMTNLRHLITHCQQQLLESDKRRHLMTPPMKIKPDFPVHWENPADEALFWMREGLHFPEPVTPLDFSLNVEALVAGINLAAKAYDEQAVVIHNRYINSYVYWGTDTRFSSALDAAAQWERYQEKVNPVIEALGELWEKSWLPEIKSHLAYWEAYDLEGADMAALLEHLNETQRRLERLWEIHALLLTPSMLAVSLFDEMVQDLFNLEHQAGHFKGVELLVGFENQTVASGHALWELSRQALASPAVQQLFVEDDAPDVISKLTASSEGQAFLAQFNDYLQEHGKRGDKLSMDFPSWLEDPTPVIKTLQHYINQPERDLTAETKRLAKKRQEAVANAFERLEGYPQPVVDQFKKLLKAAQIGLMLTEDHRFWIDLPAFYYPRQIALEFGRRLLKAGLLAQQEDVFYLTVDELKQMAKVQALPQQGRIKIRRREMEKFVARTPPPVLGTPPLTPPPDNPLFRMSAKFWGGPPPQPPTSDTLSGYAGSPGTVRGTAKVLHSLAETDKLSPGDILVTKSTALPWTPLFATVAAIVTDTGGILSHSAVVAREYGIPAVVGTGIATTMIQDGQPIEVDGDAGLVRIMADQGETKSASSNTTGMPSEAEQESDWVEGEI